MSQIHHQFGSYSALKGVDFSLLEGEIHALVGDHRSGKTTLGKIIAGVEKKQSGSIYIRGKEYANLTIRQAQKLGIGIVCQKQNLVPSLNAVDNMFCGFRSNFFITRSDRRLMLSRSQRILKYFNSEIPLDTPLYKLSEEQQLIVNICSVLIREPKIFIIDEIAANMPPHQLEQLFSVLNLLKSQGTSIIYITSNFNEIFKIADRVTVFKDGYRKGTEVVSALDPARLIDIAFEQQKSTRDLNSFFDSFQESIINELPVGSILIGEDRSVVFINEQAHQILGSSSGKEQNRSIISLLPFLTSQQTSTIMSAIHGTEQEISGVHFGEKILKLRSNPIYNQKKAAIGINIFIEDVSFDYQTREYLMKARKAANTAELAAGVAHEIKNPLGIIQNYIELLKLSEHTQEDDEYLKSIERELKRITEIIGNLLSFSKVRQTPFRPVDISKTLDEVLLLLGHKVSQKRISVVKNFIAEPILSADENKLKQLFMNLIMNAVEAVLEEGTITVSITEHRSEDLVDIMIRDDGYGISDDISDSIFKPFFTTKMARTNIGLGLSICQTIVEMHKGVLKFSSIPGQQTTFCITLPCAAAQEDPYV